MKLWTSTYLFKHSWETVTQALWRKYPNDLNPNVKAIDVIDRSVSEDGKLHSTRILGTQWNFPTFITQLLGMPDMCYALEHSVVDLKEQTMTMKSVNLTFSSVMEVEETIIYRINPEDNTTTQMSQEAAINITGVAFKDYCEGMVASAFDSNASKGREAIEQVIAKISFENVMDKVADQMQDLCVSLEETKATLSSEFEEITSKLTSEFDEIKGKLNDELDGLSILIQGPLTTNSSLLSTKQSGPIVHSDSTAKPSLMAQVIDSGFTAR